MGVVESVPGCFSGFRVLISTVRYNRGRIRDVQLRYLKTCDTRWL